VARRWPGALRLRGSLTQEELRKTLDACTESRYFSDHAQLVPRLSKWLSQGVNLDPDSLQTLERGLTALEFAEEPGKNSIRPYPGPFLLLPLLYFAQAKRVDRRSCRVFMCGLRQSVAPDSQNQLLGVDPLVAVDSLLMHVPDNILNDVFALAEREDDPTIRVLGRILRRAIKS
jgi:hypothetical protein